MCLLVELLILLIALVDFIKQRHVRDFRRRLVVTRDVVLRLDMGEAKEGRRQARNGVIAMRDAEVASSLRSRKEIRRLLRADLRGAVRVLHIRISISFSSI